MKLCLTLAALIALSLPELAGEVLSSTELKAITDADQMDRRPGGAKIDWAAVAPRDLAREARVKELIQAGQLRTDQDYYNAALVLQHGLSVEAIRLAHSLATISSFMNPENKSAKWLAAASWDRMMVYLKRPQWYATQYHRIPGTNKLVLDEVDESAVTDEEREAAGGQSIAKAKAYADSRNK